MIPLTYVLTVVGALAIGLLGAALIVWFLTEFLS